MRKPDQVAMGKEKVSSTNTTKAKLRKGLWSPEEDEKLMNYMLNNGQGCWSDIARNAGLVRCGKSCRLRWINYLRPDLKRGAFTKQEEEIIIQLHSILGNRWSQIAARLPGRTDNEIKNFWNSTIKKRLKNSNIFSNETSISPNSSASADQMMSLPDNLMGFSSSVAIFMQEYDVVCMDSSSSSKSSMQAYSSMPPLFTHLSHNLIEANGVAASSDPMLNFNACMMQEQGVAGAVEMGVHDDRVIMGLENDLSVPGMKWDYGVEKDDFVEKSRGIVVDNSPFLNHNGEELVGVGNHWQRENLKMGELEWESLLANIASLSYIDFHVE